MDNSYLFPDHDTSLEGQSDHLSYAPLTGRRAYQWRVATRTREILADGDDGEPMTAGADTDGRFWISPGEDCHIILRQGPMELATFTPDGPVPGATMAPGVLADVHLETDTKALREIDGPTRLWSAYGSFPGLVAFFPRLPDDPTEDARCRWSFAVRDERAAISVEAQRRGSTQAIPAEYSDDDGYILSPDLTVADWFRIDGVDVAHLKLAPFPIVANHSRGESKIHRDGQFSGEYLITAKGVVLAARVELRHHLATSIAGTKSRTNRREVLLLGELRLAQTEGNEPVPTALSNAHGDSQ